MTLQCYRRQVRGVAVRASLPGQVSGIRDQVRGIWQTVLTAATVFLMPDPCHLIPDLGPVAQPVRAHA